jgi:hypothetical protein
MQNKNTAEENLAVIMLLIKNNEELREVNKANQNELEKLRQKVGQRERSQLRTDVTEFDLISGNMWDELDVMKSFLKRERMTGKIERFDDVMTLLNHIMDDIAYSHSNGDSDCESDMRAWDNS